MAESDGKLPADRIAGRFAGIGRVGGIGKRRGASILTGMIVAAGLVSVAPAAADLEDDKQRADAAAADAHGEVVAVNKRVDRATKRLLEVREELPQANARFSAATAAQAQADADNRNATRKLEQAQGDIGAATARMGRIEGQIDGLRGDVGEFARRAYQMGPFAELELLLESKDPADFTHRLESIRIMSRSSGVALTTMSENRADLGHAQIRLGALRDVAVDKTKVAETRLAAAQVAASEAVSAKARVDDLVAAEESALATVRAKRTEVKASYDDLAEEQAQIEAEIAEAVRRAERRLKREAARRAAAEREAARRAAAEREAAERAAAEREAAARRAAKRAKSKQSPKTSSSRGSGSSSRSTKPKTTRPKPRKTSKPRRSSSGGGGSTSTSGQWTFPISGGRIGSEAGMRFHPILRYTKCHTGVDIAARSGTPIRAAANGVVVMAGWSGGFGQYTTISHGNGVTSSYAHQSRIGVRNGQWVNKGQTIGYVGSTGYSTGPHLHFEARIYGVVYNPRGWLGSGSKTRACG